MIKPPVNTYKISNIYPRLLSCFNFLVRKNNLFFLFLLLVSLNLSCNLNLSLPFSSQATPTMVTTSQEDYLPKTMVTFNVQIPADTPGDELIMINFLDEVTGLAFNIEKYSMEASDNSYYSISLPLPIGATVKYRYSREGNYTAHEYATNKRPIRYRLYHIEAPAEVFDIVSAWSDTNYDGDVGRITGQAIDTQTAQPLPNLLITAGGIHTITSADGSFLIEGLPPGTHNLVAYAMDGAYRTFQQGALIAADSTTPAPLRLKQSPLVNIVFTVRVPDNTMPVVPIRLAGNLTQLGNTFADLSGGISTLAVRMPVLSTLPDGRFSLVLSLPAGADIRYKYTLGDGFWNAEHDLEGNFRLRRIIVPEDTLIIEDVVDSWSDQKAGAILFDLTVPDNTPSDNHVSIQFNPYDWTESIPMWRLGEHRWVFILYSPFDSLDKFGYRYCRNDQCNSADDALTPGPDSFGRMVETKDELQTIIDKVEEWMWLEPLSSPVTISSPEIRQRDDEFMAGVEFHSYYHPSWPPHIPAAFEGVQTLGANWVVISPSWTFTNSSPLALELVPGRDPLWSDTTSILSSPNNYGLNVALYPTPRFPIPADEWWESAPRNFEWWLSWFEHYRRFILNFAIQAEHHDVDALILGGDWVLPALPDGHLSNMTSSNVPDNAEERWRKLISDVRLLFSGKIIWSLSLDRGISSPPEFLDEMDKIYLLWAVPLAEEPGSSESDLHMRAANILDGVIKGFQSEVGKPVIIGVSYPSAESSSTGCLPDPLSNTRITCLDIDLLAAPNPDIPGINLDLEEQTLIYNSLLVAINERDFISGFVSRGYYLPAVLKDKSASVHGKPAEAVLEYWFPRMLGLLSP
jgi:hypothetical protein